MDLALWDFLLIMAGQEIHGITEVHAIRATLDGVETFGAVIAAAHSQVEVGQNTVVELLM